MEMAVKEERRSEVLHIVKGKNVTESTLALLAARQANKSGDEVLRQRIRLYSESWKTEKMAE